MSLLGEVPCAILMLRDMHAWAVSGHWLDYAVTDDLLIDEKQTRDGMRELLYDAYRCLLRRRDRLMNRAQYVYYSAALTTPRDTALY